jgi:hypothetical protein
LVCRGGYYSLQTGQNIDEEILRLQLRLQEKIPAGVLDPQAPLRPRIRVSVPTQKRTPYKVKGGRLAAFLAPIAVAAGPSCAQASGLDPEIAEDLGEAFGSVPLSPAEIPFAGVSMLWDVYSENHALPGSKSYEMKQLVEAYVNAPLASVKATGVGGSPGTVPDSTRRIPQIFILCPCSNFHISLIKSGFD